MITIIDYGMGNLGSIQNMFKRVGAECQITADIRKIIASNKILLPGVGAFDTAMSKINAIEGLRVVLDKKALEEKVPVLGICLGMQLLTKRSDEGQLPGLGWVEAETLQFPRKSNPSLKIPHMGWNEVFIKKASRLVNELPEDPRFYFVHSYHVRCCNDEDILCTTNYGMEFHSMIQHENIMGAQFHPEKSHKFGMKIFENFAKL